GEEVFHMASDSGSDVLLQIFLGLVFRILLQFVSDVLVESFAFAQRRKIVAHDAGLQGAFVAVNSSSPRIFWIGRAAPGAVLPDDLEVAIIESGALGV